MQIKKWNGKPISEPSIVSGMSLEKYHSADICVDPSVSSSGLRKIIQTSPAHFFHSWSGNPNAEREEPSKYMVLGQAAHHLLLSQEAFATQFVVRPKKFDSWRTNDAKAWRAAEESEGRTVLIPEQLDQVRGMARALAAHPIVQAGILDGEVEASMFWKDEETGLYLKSRPDAIPNDSGDFADLKVTHSVLDVDLRQTIDRGGYHMQGALVCEGGYRLRGLPTTTFTLVFVEDSPPHCVRVVTLPEADLQRGERQNRHAVRVFAKCLSENNWPGPGNADAEMLGLSERSALWIDNQIAKWGV